ncbi:MAG: hypothetical protein H0X08_07970 [Blastocatellia bacterium]|nr:hypothetical protein [Blastocatellia bacterium]
MTGLMGAIIVSGFFFAARQHFLSWDYGMKNSRLRKQLDDLETEKRRLLLARENSSSPTEVKRSAKKLGLFDTPSEVAPRAELASLTLPARPESIVEAKVTKTVDAKRLNYTVVPASIKTSAPKSSKAEREPRREMAE